MTTRYALLPWSAIDYGFGAELIKSADGKELAMRQDGASVADMRLMAAAPELLAELEYAHAILTVLLNLVPEDRKHEMAERLAKIHDGEGAVRFHERRAAIAKAKGEPA